MGLGSLVPESIPGFAPCCRGERGTASTGRCSGGRCCASITSRVQQAAEGKRVSSKSGGIFRLRDVFEKWQTQTGSSHKLVRP